MESIITSIQIPDYSINNENYTIFNFSRFSLLERLEIGNECFMYVNEFVINELNDLILLKIGEYSFTHLKSYDEWDWNKANNTNRSFSISNCVKLESIEIGLFSFSDYGGGFELLYLPKLSTIKIGEIGRYYDSFNFFYSSFMIKGIIYVILVMNRSS